MLPVWEYIHSKLAEEIPVMLLYVLESEGSSPGRKGFKLAVAKDGTFIGTIGGGIMEIKLVEKAISMLHKSELSIQVMKQHHDKQHTVNQSGMICSGSQLNAFIPFQMHQIELVKSILNNPKLTLEINPTTITLLNTSENSFEYTDELNWNYKETILVQPVIHIVGGGHVALALSEVMQFLGFYIYVYDDRPDINTIQQNKFAHQVIIIPSYNEIDKYIPLNSTDFIAIMTVGYRTDKIALIQLINKQFKYLGLLGSEHKIITLLAELKEEGISPDLLSKIYTPIGLKIYSKSPQEIAVSVAAEIILVKNKNEPTGRSY